MLPTPLVLNLKRHGHDMKIIIFLFVSIFFSSPLLASCASVRPEASVKSYSEVREIYLNIRSATPDEQQARAAAEVENIASSLSSLDEAVVVQVADILRLAGCNARNKLPDLRRSLSRFQGPEKQTNEGVLGMVVPSYGAWGSIYNSISVIEGDRRCDVDKTDE